MLPQRQFTISTFCHFVSSSFEIGSSFEGLSSTFALQLGQVMNLGLGLFGFEVQE